MSAAELRAGVERRLRRSVFTQDADLVLRGNIEFRGGQAHAELELRTADTDSGRHGTLVGSRDLDMEGDDCRVLDDSLLLVTSIMIDVPREELPPPPAPEEPPPEVEKPKAVPPLGTPIRLPKPPAPQSPPPTAPIAPEPWAYSLFVDATTTAGALPLASFGGDLGLRIEPGGFWPLELSAAYDHGLASEEEGDLQLDSVMWGLTVCPVDFGLELCAGQRVGAIWARGDQLANNRTRRRIRGEISLGLRWAPQLGSNHLVIGLDGLMPLVQDRYFYERQGGEVELFQVAAVGAKFSLGFRLGL